MNVRRTFAVIMIVFSAHGAELTPEALTAWRDYIRAARDSMEQHLHPGSHFLDIDEDQESLRRLRTGEILVSPVGARGLKKVPSGTIHDWVGTAFIEHARLADVLSVVRDYDHYPEFYRPTVISSKALERKAREDQFSMLLLAKSPFLKSAFDGEYECSYASVGNHRWYSISKTTRMREIESYGEPGQRTLNEQEGHGFIWRLFSLTRYEERDGGVYIELEAIALSRDIPASVRWIVEPIVRRFSRNSLITSLRQTKDAVNMVTVTTDRKRPGWSCSTNQFCGSQGPNSAAAHSLR